MDLEYLDGLRLLSRRRRMGSNFVKLVFLAVFGYFMLSFKRIFQLFYDEVFKEASLFFSVDFHSFPNMYSGFTVYSITKAPL